MRELPDPFPLNAPLADPPDEPPGRPMDWLMGLTFGRVLWALLAGLAVAVVLNPIFGSPFPILLARVWIVAMVGLLTFQITSRWPARWRPAWLPSWVLQLVSMVVVVPAASLFAAVLSAGGTWEAFAGDSSGIISDSDVVTTASAQGMQKTCVQEVGSNTVSSGAANTSRYGTTAAPQVVVLRGDLVNICK